MVSVKIKKQLTIPQLIEWIGKNGIFGESFGSDRYNYVHVTDDGIIEFTGEFYEDTFEVEVEEEVTEDTKLPRILVNDGKSFLSYYNITIKNLEKRFESYVYGIETIHLINNDSTHTLIYKNGALV